MEKKLYRSKNNKTLCGVCGGIAEYFQIDPTVVRLIWAFLTLCAGMNILVYILCALIIPQEA